MGMKKNSQVLVFGLTQLKSDELSILNSSTRDESTRIDSNLGDELLKPDNVNTPIAQCQSCQFEVTSRDEQVAHYKSDWHRYNIKRNLRNETPVSESFFCANVVDQDDTSSISGSDSESDEGIVISSSQPFEESVKTFSSPKLLLELPGQNKLYSIHRCLVVRKKEELDDSQLVDRVKALASQSMVRTVVIMLASGHFAGAVFENDVPVAHKTYHKYVVRAKQGTSQSSSDNRGHKSKSAGANLRRYCEASLREDVAALIRSWSKQISEASFVFVRCSTESSSVLFNGKSPLLNKNDDRLRYVPFPTQRPTFSELKRVFQKLFQITELDRESYTANRTRRKSFSPKKPELEKNSDDDCARKSSDPVKKIATPEISHGPIIEQERDCDSPVESDVEELSENPVVEQLRSLYRSSPEGCLQFLKTNLEFFKEHRMLNGDTCLHHFSRLNDCGFIEFLLENDFDVTERNEKNKTPCQLVAQKKARNVFRRFRANYPDKFDYSQTGIPEPLDETTEKEKLEKLAQKRKQNKQRRKEAAKVEREAEELTKVEEKQKQDFLKLTDREKRALAAERRFGNSCGNNSTLRCFQCARNIEQLVPFKYDENSFCTTDCVAHHRTSSKSK